MEVLTVSDHWEEGGGTVQLAVCVTTRNCRVREGFIPAFWSQLYQGNNTRYSFYFTIKKTNTGDEREKCLKDVNRPTFSQIAS